MSPLKKVTIGPVAEENEDKRIEIDEGDTLTSIHVESVNDDDKSHSKKTKKKKKKKKKEEEEENRDEEKGKNGDDQNGGFILSDEEMKNRGLELSPEEKRIHQKYKKEPSCKDHVIFSPTLRIFYVVALCLMLGLLIPFLLDSYSFNSNESRKVSGDCLINSSFRVSCRDEEGLSLDSCLDIGCCYDESYYASNPYIPRCYHKLPSSYGYIYADANTDNDDITFYRLADKTNMTFRLNSKNKTTIYDTDAWSVVAVVQRLCDDIVRVVLSSPENDEAIPYDDVEAMSSTNYSLDVVVEADNSGNGFIFTVFRITGNQSDSDYISEKEGVALFQSYYGPLEYGEGLIEITGHVPSQHIYGLGQRDSVYLLPTFDQWRKWPLMNREQASTGSFPFYFLREPSGLFHGVLLKNTAPLEIGVLPAPSIVFKSMKGALDFTFFGGPSPRDVSMQYSGLVGFPSMPPYWGLGYHLCRSTIEKDPLESYRNVSSDMEDSSIPYESDCLNGRLTYPDSFADLPSDITDEVLSMGKKNRKFMLVGHPFLSVGTDVYEEALEKAFLVQLSDNASYYGEIDSKSVAYLDFLSERIVDNFLYPSSTIQGRYAIADGVALFRNSPLNEAQINYTLTSEATLENCTSDSPEWCCTPYKLPFIPYNLPEEVTNNSVCWRAQSPSSGASHLSLHNAYGSLHALRMKQLLENIKEGDPDSVNTRPFVLSSSVSPGASSGFMPEGYGPDFVSQQKALTQVILMGIYGVPLSGTPLCGSQDYAEEPLRPEWCLRAHENGVFLPIVFSYYEEGQSPRNPSVSTVQNFTAGFIENIRTFVRLRYLFIPYLYTLFYEASVTGVPVVRPLFYEFPNDQDCLDISSQYMAGSGLLVTPALTSQGADSDSGSLVIAHFPPDAWYDFYTGALFANDTYNGTDVTLTVMSTELPVHVRAGYVIPLQGELNNPDLITTSDWRQTSFTFVIGLDQTKSGQDSILASGHLYLDDGVTPLENVTGSGVVTVEAFDQRVSIRHEGSFCDSNPEGYSTMVSSVRIFGSSLIDTSSVTINDGQGVTVSQDADTLAVILGDLSADFCDSDIEIKWEIYEEVSISP